MSPVKFHLLLLLLPLCLLLVGVCNSAPNTGTGTNGPFEPRPHQDSEVKEAPFMMIDEDFTDDFNPSRGNDARYVGYCRESLVYMWPGNTRKFWSYGYVHLKEAYPANCTLKYTFTTRSNPSDNFLKFGFKITGTFTGPNILVTRCNETDYVTIDDTAGSTATYCGTNAIIDFSTGSDYFEFYFKSQEYSPGALGFFVTIESYPLCGGLLNSVTDGPTGFITTPLHSNEYPANSNCAWWFTALEETTIRLECSSFLLEDQSVFPNGTSYCSDYMSVSFEALTPDTTTYYCNSDMDILSKTIYSAGNNLLVTFKSDSENHYSGFNCTYDFVLYGI